MLIDDADSRERSLRNIDVSEAQPGHSEPPKRRSHVEAGEERDLDLRRGVRR
jgi:hypothetical protein